MGPVTKLKRRKTYKKNKYKCVYCGCSDRSKLTIDHILPKAHGGTNDMSNLQTLCLSCNNDKGEELNYFYTPPHFILLIKQLKAEFKNKIYGIKHNKKRAIQTKAYGHPCSNSKWPSKLWRDIVIRQYRRRNQIRSTG